MTDADEVLDELDPKPAVEALPVSRRATLQALASVGALGTVGSASAQDAAGGVIAEEAYFSNYGWEPDSDGGTLTIDGEDIGFDGSDEIELPDGSTATEVVLPGGTTASEVIGPDGGVLWEEPIPDGAIYYEGEYEDDWKEGDVSGSGSFAKEEDHLYLIVEDNTNNAARRAWQSVEKYDLSQYDNIELEYEAPRLEAISVLAILENDDDDYRDAAEDWSLSETSSRDNLSVDISDRESEYYIAVAGSDNITDEEKVVETLVYKVLLE